MLDYRLTGKIAAILALAALAGCPAERKGPALSTTPVSIRGWLADPAADSPPGVFHLSDTASGEAAHRARVFEQTTLSVEGNPFASGGMAFNGSFIILDAPPGDVTITFQPPEGGEARLLLTAVPPNADVLLPALTISGAQVIPSDPAAIVVRVAGRGETRRPIPAATTVGGHKVAVYEVPLHEMMDRREYPQPR